jgi:hypothetical protein
MVEELSKSYMQDVEADNEQEAIRKAKKSLDWTVWNEWGDSVPSYTAEKL